MEIADIYQLHSQHYFPKKMSNLATAMYEGPSDGLKDTKSNGMEIDEKSTKLDDKKEQNRSASNDMNKPTDQKSTDKKEDQKTDRLISSASNDTKTTDRKDDQKSTDKKEDQKTDRLISSASNDTKTTDRKSSASNDMNKPTDQKSSERRDDSKSATERKDDKKTSDKKDEQKDRLVSNDMKVDQNKSEKKDDQVSERRPSSEKKDDQKRFKKDDQKDTDGSDKKFADQTWTEAGSKLVDKLTEKPILENAGNLAYGIASTIGEMGHQAINAVVSTPTSEKVKDTGRDK